MKIKHLLLLGGVAAFSSCSTAYRSGQTPDDVYYSPAPQENTYVSTVTENDKNSYSYRNQEETDIRRGINDPVYRNAITFSMGMGYGYNPYSLYPYNTFNNPFYGYDGYGYNPYGMKGMYDPYYNSIGYNNLNFYSSPFGYYNSYPLGFGYSPYYGGYTPYYAPILFSSKSVNTNTGPRRYNLNVYNPNNSSNNNSRGNVQPIRSTGTGTTQPGRQTGVGTVIRRVFTPSQRNSYNPPSNNTRRTYNYNNNNDNNNNSYQTPQRTFTPSNNSSSSSSSSGSSNSAPVRTFRR